MELINEQLEYRVFIHFRDTVRVGGKADFINFYKII